MLKSAAFQLEHAEVGLGDVSRDQYVLPHLVSDVA
jgi:hypothetical protein